MGYGSSVGRDLLNVPMGDMIKEMAFAIAEAQVKLDENSIEVAQMMGGLKTIVDEATGEVTFSDSRVFFGKEAIPFNNAVDIYNSTTDADLKLILKTEHLDSQSDTAAEPDAGKIMTYDPVADTYAFKVGKTKESLVTIPTRLSMLELGFTPTFYQFVDTIIEVKMAISMSRETSSTASLSSTTTTKTKSKNVSWKWGKYSTKKTKGVNTTQVNASYSTKYNYSAEGSSLLRTKLAPVPVPAILEERIRLSMEALQLDENV